MSATQNTLYVPSDGTIAVFNRGEAALRFIRGVGDYNGHRGTNLKTVAFLLPEERGSQVEQCADRVHWLDPQTAYAVNDELVVAMKSAGCHGLWPGWGFASEDPALPALLEQHGLVFLGPREEAILTLGDKIRSKRAAEEAGIPVIPWATIESAEHLVPEGERIGYPLMLKASGGGGGRGIRVVQAPPQLLSAYKSATNEAPGSVFMEKYCTAGRHIEVQVVADGKGGVQTYGLRDCSLQRRRQKVIEEAPAQLPPKLSKKTERWAISLAKNVNYRSAGTVEFLKTPEGIFFLEMNPRLQVEHCVTEEAFGVDLVALQLDVALGLPLQEGPKRAAFHSIEARIYAEDPVSGFLPAPGRLTHLHYGSGPGLRVDSGVTSGETIPSRFDPMIAKVIARGRDREEALARLTRSLGETEIHVHEGTTNLPFLSFLLSQDAVRENRYSTEYIDTTLLPAFLSVPQEYYGPAAFAAAVLEYTKIEQEAVNNFAVRPLLSGTQEKSPTISLNCAAGNTTLQVSRLGRHDYLLRRDEEYLAVEWVEESPRGARLTVKDREFHLLCENRNGQWRITIDGHSIVFDLQDRGVVKAPAPAMVNAVHVEIGDRVVEGDLLFTMEAMKMELPVHAHEEGIVERIEVQQGSQIFAGGVLARLTSSQQSASVLLPLELDGGYPSPGEAMTLLEGALFGYDVTPKEVELALGALAQANDSAAQAVLQRVHTLLIQSAWLLELSSPLRQFSLTKPREKRASGRALLALLIRNSRTCFNTLPEAFTALLERVVRAYGDAPLQPGPFLTYALYRLRRVLNQSLFKRRVITDLLAFLGSTIELPQSPGVELSRALMVISADVKGNTRQTDLAEYARDYLFDRPIRERRSHETVALLKTHVEGQSVDPALLASTIRRATLPELLPLYEGALASPTLLSETLHHFATLFWGSMLQGFTPPQGTPLQEGEAMISQEVGHAPQRRQVRLAASVREALESLSRQLPDGTHAVEIITKTIDLSLEDLPKTLNDLSIDVEEIVLVELQSGLAHTFRSPIGNAFVKVDSLKGMHPAQAARLELWRFSQFQLTPLPAHPGVRLYSCTATRQPQDERLLAMVEIFDPEVITGDDGLRKLPGLSLAFRTACQSMRNAQSKKNKRDRLHWNHLVLSVNPMPQLTQEEMRAISAELVPFGSHLGLEKVIVYAEVETPAGPKPWSFKIRGSLQEGLSFEQGPRDTSLVQPIGERSRQEIHARRRGFNAPESLLRILKTDLEGNATGTFLPYEILLDPSTGQQHLIQEEWPENPTSGVLFGILSHVTPGHPEGLRRVTILSNPLQNMGSLAEGECRRIIGALDLAQKEGLGVYWIPISAGAKIDFQSGTENLDWTARVLRHIVEFTQGGGVIDILVSGVNVGAQSYFDAEATMINTTKGFLVMTEEGSMVLTGKRALDVSGAVSAEDNLGIGGCERIMGPTGQAQAMVKDFRDGHALLLTHGDLILPGKGGIARFDTRDPLDRDITAAPYPIELGHGFTRIEAIFNEETNPGRKRPFSVKPVMEAVRDRDAPVVERWGNLTEGAEGVTVWETRLGGIPVGLMGIDATQVFRVGQIPSDGPESFSPSTLFPKGSYKLARGISALSGQLPVVIFANLSGFDGSPESLRKWQLIHGAQIGRALVNFSGPILLVVLSRYHGGAYVVFSTALNKDMEAVALKGSFASVIGGSAAASVVFSSSIRREVEAHPDVTALRDQLKQATGRQRLALETRLTELLTTLRTTLSLETAERFDRVHNVERAAKVGSLKSVIEPATLRPYIIDFLNTKLS